MTTSDDDFDDPVTSWLDQLSESEERPPLLQYQDGSWAIVGDDGWPSAPVMLGRNLLEAPASTALPGSAIDIEAESVADVEIGRSGPGSEISR